RCTYPQEIVLRVTCGTARVRKLQILSHHYKIASKLEIYVGSIQQKISTNTSDNDNSNERANYKARELKSVKLDAEGEFIRLVARSCHENPLNQHKQIGIVAITVMASPETCIVPIDSMTIDCSQNDHQNFTSLYSILPNSSSANNSSTALPDQVEVDKPATSPITSPNEFILLNAKNTADLISAFERAKQNASAEDVSRLDSLKRRAIDEEDFDNADKYKVIISYLEEEGLDLDESGEVIVLDSLDPELADIIGLADDSSE
ncbi:11725_t:CDS:2, partial [Cetraspora pellucida]